MTYEHLVEFLTRKMSMSHVYQPPSLSPLMGSRSCILLEAYADRSLNQYFRNGCVILTANVAMPLGCRQKLRASLNGE